MGKLPNGSWDGGSGNYAFTGAGRKRVADSFVWFPRWTFAPLLPKCCAIYLQHNVWDELEPLFGSLEDVDFFLPHSQHDSDPFKDYNPLYSVAGRNERGEIYSVVSSYPWLHNDSLQI